MSDSTELLILNDAPVRRNGQLVWQGSEFHLHAGECWMVTGPTGGGKSIFLQLLAGKMPAPVGTVIRRQSIGYVSFREESRLFSYSGHFYQQRYQATMSDDAPSLRDFLQAGSSPETDALLDRLGLTALLDRSFLKLSNGQTRKARIGKVLLQHPTILLLDNPFVGLDATFRQELTQWLGELVGHGLTLVFVSDQTDVPPFVSHVVSIDSGRVQQVDTRASYQPVVRDQQKQPLPDWQTPPKPADFDEVFRLTDVTVRYGETVILDRINWTVRASERWALLGANGAGKSVLLSLLYGDHPQAYANDVRVFGYRRGKAGESIWDVKRRIGFVSPELHLYFPQHLSVRQVILSGLTDTLTPPTHVPPQAAADLMQLLTYFAIPDRIDRSFGSLSAGEQRLVLLIRALSKNPPVLLLDEPFQALDESHVQLARTLIDSLNNKTILFITHDRKELPESINRVFSL